MNLDSADSLIYRRDESISFCCSMKIKGGEMYN